MCGCRRRHAVMQHPACSCCLRTPAYHLRPKAEMPSLSGCLIGTMMQYCGGSSNSCMQGSGGWGDGLGAEPCLRPGLPAEPATHAATTRPACPAAPTACLGRLVWVRLEQEGQDGEAGVRALGRLPAVVLLQHLRELSLCRVSHHGAVGLGEAGPSAWWQAGGGGGEENGTSLDGRRTAWRCVWWLADARALTG